MSASVRAVVFDVGSTLFDETRPWAGWARWLGVSEASFFAALGAVIADGDHEAEVFRFFDHGHIVPAAVRAERMANGEADEFGIEDLYPDAVPCLRELRAAGMVVGIAGNQLRHRHAVLEGFDLPVDFIGTSGVWGVEKPAAGFFGKVAESCAIPPSQIAYVGDRLDNDVLPALKAGMSTVFLRRGPWAYIHARLPEIRRAHIRIDSLAELPERLRAWNTAASGAR